VISWARVDSPDRFLLSGPGASVREVYTERPGCWIAHLWSWLLTASHVSMGLEAGTWSLPQTYCVAGSVEIPLAANS